MLESKLELESDSVPCKRMFFFILGSLGADFFRGFSVKIFSLPFSVIKFFADYDGNKTFCVYDT